MSTTKPPITLRAALSSDIPALATIDIAAHPHHPIARLAWASPTDAHPLFVARYKHLLSLRYHFLVATQSSPLPDPVSPSNEQIIGFAVWKHASKARDAEEEPEFSPVFPDGASFELIRYFLAENKKHAVKLQGVVEGCAELEALAVSPEVQRRGVGSLLVQTVVAEMDKRGERCYVKSSKVGKGLYEKFGWMVMGEDGESGFKVELKDYGVEEGYTSWDMMREVGGVR